MSSDVVQCKYPLCMRLKGNKKYVIDIASCEFPIYLLDFEYRNTSLKCQFQELATKKKVRYPLTNKYVKCQTSLS